VKFKPLVTLAKVADHAAGATTRSSGSSPDKRTNTNPPKAASKGGSSEGGARNMGRASISDCRTVVAVVDDIVAGTLFRRLRLLFLATGIACRGIAGGRLAQLLIARRLIPGILAGSAFV
jgi:hypothetical protein